MLVKLIIICLLFFNVNLLKKFKNLANMIQNLQICQLAVVAIRATPSHKAEMVSQLLFGELFRIIDTQFNWLEIKLVNDGYQGWIDKNQHQKTDEIEINELENTKPYLTCKAFTKVYNPTKTFEFNLPFGSNLHFLKNNKLDFNGILNEFNSEDYILPNPTNFAQNLEKFARLFLNIPYLWGGKTHFGIDCSGFTQQVFKVLGIQLYRDAWQQAEQGTLVDFLETAKPGDLAFFDNPESRITHVGILLNGQQIIHASGRVKIDKIDNYGIFSEEQNIYSHKLRILKRYV
jgi:hypothetical protein